MQRTPRLLWSASSLARPQTSWSLPELQRVGCKLFSFLCCSSADVARFCPLQPVLYACENDHKAVEQLKELVAGKVSVVPCMVDRICSSRSIEASSIVVNTEPWRGNIIPQAPMAELSKPAVGEGAVPLAGSSVFVPRTMEVADYR